MRRCRETEDFAEFSEVAFRFNRDRKAVGDSLKAFRFFGGAVQIGEKIAELGGLFVFLGRSGLFHFGFELGLHFLALPFEEIASGFDLVDVLVARNVADARRGAVFEMGVEAMFVVAFGGCQWAATAQMVLATDERKCAAKRAGVWEWTEVTRAVVLLDAGEGKAWNRVVQVYFDQEEPFVVAETDVVARMKFFDEFAFKEEGLGFAADDVIIEIVNAFDKSAEFEVPAHPAGRLEVLGDAFPQIASFADINHGAEAVAHEVDPGLMREIAKLFLDVVGN